ncbi:MAG: hypothetical protein HRT36_05005 [Alphaproteobacteria bacterium]|nr:hypothetical protein [Alphaproteobacteria bacterium]
MISFLLAFWPEYQLFCFHVGQAVPLHQLEGPSSAVFMPTGLPDQSFDPLKTPANRGLVHPLYKEPENLA